MMRCAQGRFKSCRASQLIAVFFAVLTTAHLLAQTDGAAGTATAAPQAASFEVASIKLNKSGSGNSNSDFDHGRFTATNVRVKSLIQYEAYGITGAQIAGGPSWLDSEAFDISAKVDDATAEQLKTLDRDQRHQFEQQLFQQLLADRFKLAVHWETKQLPVYALVIAKSGAKLTKSTDAGGSTSVSSDGRKAKMTAKGVTMAELAQTLTQDSSRDMGRMIIDKTGLEGRYDLVLQWMPDSGSTAMANTANDGPDGTSIFTALQEQLGLKLESAKGPVKTLVIDHVEQPSEN
jgi:uncharacterized protein (TIGR03435 family)